MQRPGELYRCAGRHQTAVNFKKSFITSVRSNWFQLTPISLPPCLSCLSFVLLGSSIGKTGLSETCVFLEVKGKRQLKGLMQHRSTTKDYH